MDRCLKWFGGTSSVLPYLTVGDRVIALTLTLTLTLTRFKPTDGTRCEPNRAPQPLPEAARKKLRSGVLWTGLLWPSGLTLAALAAVG